MEAYILPERFSDFSGSDEADAGVKTGLESRRVLRMDHSDLERES